MPYLWISRVLLPEQDISPLLSSLYNKGSTLPGLYHASHWQACRVAGGGEGCLVRFTQSPGDGFTCEENPSSDRMSHFCGSSLFCPMHAEDPLLPPTTWDLGIRQVSSLHSCHTIYIYTLYFLSEIFKELNPGLFEKNKGPGRPRIYTADIMLPFVQ